MQIGGHLVWQIGLDYGGHKIWQLKANRQIKITAK